MDTIQAQKSRKAAVRSHREQRRSDRAKTESETRRQREPQTARESTSSYEAEPEIVRLKVSYCAPLDDGRGQLVTRSAGYEGRHGST